MAKTYKSFVKEYAMGLQVPATSFMKPTASMKLKKREDYDRDDEVSGKKVFKVARHMPKDSAGKIDLDEPTRKGSPLKKAKKVDAKPKTAATTHNHLQSIKGWHLDLFRKFQTMLMVKKLK